MKLLAAIVLCFTMSGAYALAAPDGAKLFADRCAACHDHPRGRIPPHYVLNGLWPDQVVDALTTGPMKQQAVGLSKDDIGALQALPVSFKFAPPDATYHYVLSSTTNKPAGGTGHASTPTASRRIAVLARA